MDDNEVVAAFKRWRDSLTRACCTQPNSSGHYDRQGDPLPDDMVCDRERAWRDYVRLRDVRNVYVSHQRPRKTEEDLCLNTLQPTTTLPH